MAPPTKRLRFGFLSTARIAEKYAEAMRDSRFCALECVGSRSLERAQDFAGEFGFQRAYGSYDQVLADERVDAVYIPLPTSLHKEWAVKAAAAGKHVLCEKPIAPTVAETEEILDACAKAGVMFMDGTMFMHHPRLEQVKKHASPAMIGAIRRLDSHFCIAGSDDFHAHNIRVKKDLEPLGALGDLAHYSIRFFLVIMDFELPKTARATVHRWSNSGPDDGTPVSISGHLEFANGVVARFAADFDASWQQSATITGTDAFLVVDDFVIPENHRATFSVSSGFAATMPRSRYEVVTEQPQRQEVTMVDTFAGIVRKGGFADRFWSRASLATMKVLEACKASALAGGEAVSL